MLWLVLIIGGFIFASQVWFKVTMNPSGDLVELKAFDGLTTYNFISPALMVLAAALLAASFVGSLTRKIVGFLALAVSTLVGILTAVSIANRDISQLRSEIESLTGIATQHGLDNVQIELEVWPWVSVACFAATTALLIVFLATESRWPKRVAKISISEAKPASEPEDAIGIWDSQR